MAVVAGPCGEARAGLIWKLETGKSKLEMRKSKLETRTSKIAGRQSTIENRPGVLRRVFSFPVFLGSGLAAGAVLATGWVFGVPGSSIIST